MIIQNRATLATTPLRSQVLDILEAGVSRVLPDRIMGSISFDPSRRILTVQGDAFPVRGRLFVIGGGKASGLMAQRLESIVGAENITDGVVTVKSGRQAASKIALIEAGHPIPDQRGVAAVRRMLGLKERYGIDAGDVVLCLISGGGSALMPCPLAGLSLEDKQEVTRLLIASGADINRINTVRKHLSVTKGGRLAAYFAPAAVISLVLSDVIGNDLSTIASGPTYPDPSTYADAVNILKGYGLLSKAPVKVREVLEQGVADGLPETPKALANALANAHNYIIGDNSLALSAMAERATALGLRPRILTAEQKGDTATVARARAAEVMAASDGYNVYLIGGETTPTLPPHPGRGGRNQHYAAVSLLAMVGYAGEWVVASLGTDGSDYLPDVAGAMVDNASPAALQSQGLDIDAYVERYDSNAPLGKVGNSLIVTGGTGTNVGDVVVYLLKRAQP